MSDAKQAVLVELKKAIGKEYTPSIDELAVPPDTTLGDVAFPCFALAKGAKRNPAELATELAVKIAPKGFIKKIAAAGPYVNFTFDDAVFGEAVLNEIKEEGNTYGTSSYGEGKRVMVEFANLNTHKEIHIGHLRNVFLGQGVVNVLTANGYEVIPVSYINDMGAAVAACIWAVKHSGVSQEEGEDDLAYLQRMYVLATAKASEDPEVKAEISDIQRNLEDLKGPDVKLWKKTRDLSLKALKAAFKELNLTIDKYYLESDLIADTKSTIESLIERGIVTRSQGAWIVDLEAEKLGANLLVKSDGTLLYNAKDLALAEKKKEEYHPQRSLYVIDTRQSLIMRQLFATLKRMGFEQQTEHVSYDFVTLKEGAMSSRKGNIIRYETLRDMARDLAKEAARSRHTDWNEKQLTLTSRLVADAALRFSMLKQDGEKKIVFDMKESVSFEGFTGPYILYSYARIKSLLKKAGRRKPKIHTKHLGAGEHELLTKLAHYPSVVRSAGADLRLSGLALELFELCQAFSRYYDGSPILSAEPEVTATRLAVVDAVRQTLENGAKILGIPLVNEM